jgi:hypothetical protein
MFWIKFWILTTSLLKKIFVRSFRKCKI